MRERNRFEREVHHLGLREIGVYPSSEEIEALKERETGNQTPPRLAPGQFGKAWAVSMLYKNDDFGRNLVKLLKASPSFVKMAEKLDQRYASLWEGDRDHHITEVPKLFDKGVITTGRFQGRRVLEVRSSESGSFFRPFGPFSTGSYDVIQIDKPAQWNLGGWVELIAHESAHAFIFAAGQNKLPLNATLKARIDESIDNEILTRKIEAKVFSEAKSSSAGKKLLDQFSSTTGSFDRAVVERDFAEIGWLNTYLETFVLEDQKLEAIRAQKLDDSTVQSLNAQVDAIPLGKRPLATYLIAYPEFFDPQQNKFRKFVSQYAKARFFNRVLDARWREFNNRPAKSRDSEENMLKQHAAAFFPTQINYTKRSTKP